MLTGAEGTLTGAEGTLTGAEGTLTGAEGTVTGTGAMGEETGAGLIGEACGVIGALTGVLAGVLIGVLTGAGATGGGQPPVGHSQLSPSQPLLQLQIERETQGPECAATQLAAHGTSWNVKYAVGEAKLSIMEKSLFKGWNDGAVVIPSMNM